MRIGTREEWLAARKELLAEEKELTRARRREDVTELLDEASVDTRVRANRFGRNTGASARCCRRPCTDFRSMLRFEKTAPPMPRQLFSIAWLSGGGGIRPLDPPIDG